MIKGYWSDMVMSSFISGGIDVDSSERVHEEDTERANCLLEIINKGTGAEQHRHHSVEIAMFNVIRDLFEQVRDERSFLISQNSI